MTGNDIKTEIAGRWDISAVTYDDHHGHGIKSAVERDSWKQAFSKVLPREGILKVLDVGCGTGELSILFAEMGHEVTGIDLSQNMLSRAISKAESRGFDMRFETGDAENPPFDDGSFDLVINRHLLWTLPHPQTALDNWKRVLNDGGRAVVIDGVWDDGSFDTKARHFVSNVCSLIADRQNPWKEYYSDTLKSQLPNVGGTSLENARKYMHSAGLSDIGHLDLTHIREVQKKFMPFRRRICYNYNYYMIHGTK
ncbi:ubiquinone/menaquinone biosynthesis C-methylase UbiE [Methanohalophilus levihalophilus]|uniref:class I SAM-dependent methyltransferase n=1 Tax=Methanohalophilus levihalophilus TaxID=1431282 RepID=UPI001AE7A4C4|nr:class I SAM-dependent methyltransferase [Methanohalophilus levihalophilus]MBP2030785.1 ubiquinone/menaquinone biosynthesis C-methylase UbiE [Methanohalophilus levihalophilus]